MRVGQRRSFRHIRFGRQHIFAPAPTPLIFAASTFPCPRRSAKKWGDVEFPLPFGRMMTPQVGAVKAQGGRGASPQHVCALLACVSLGLPGKRPSGGLHVQHGT